MVMKLRSANQYMVLRNGKVLMTPTKSLLKKKKKQTKLMTTRKRTVRPTIAPIPPTFSWPVVAAQKPTEQMIEDFVAITTSTKEQAEFTITKALQLGLTLDHAVEFYFTHML